MNKSEEIREIATKAYIDKVLSYDSLMDLILQMAQKGKFSCTVNELDRLKEDPTKPELATISRGSMRKISNTYVISKTTLEKLEEENFKITSERDLILENISYYNVLIINWENSSFEELYDEINSGESKECEGAIISW